MCALLFCIDSWLLCLCFLVRMNRGFRHPLTQAFALGVPAPMMQFKDKVARVTAASDSRSRGSSQNKMVTSIGKLKDKHQDAGSITKLKQGGHKVNSQNEVSSIKQKEQKLKGNSGVQAAFNSRFRIARKALEHFLSPSDSVTGN